MDKVQNTEPKAGVKTAPKNNTPVYTVSQLADGFKAFGTSRAIVECALKLAKKDSFTMDEAKKIVETFKNKR